MYTFLFRENNCYKEALEEYQIQQYLITISMSLTIAHFDLANQKMSKIVHLCTLRIDIIFAAVSDGQILPTNLIFFVLWPSQRRNKKERVGVESKMIHIGSVFGKIQKRILT